MTTSVGRNDPCPCGSGRKYKRCCGVVIQLRVASAAPTFTARATMQRECGTCTACCDGWAVATIRGYEMKPGVPCHFRGEGCCTIYAERPVEPCRNFICGWLAPGSPFPGSFRPDQLGVMIVATRWRDLPAYVLKSAGRDPDDELLAWMQQHSRATGRPFFYEQNGEKLGYGPPEFQQDMLARASRGERMW